MGWDVNNAADLSALRTTCAIIVFVLGVFMLARVAQPLNSWRGVLVAVFAAAGVIGMFIPFVARFFDLASADRAGIDRHGGGAADFHGPVRGLSRHPRLGDANFPTYQADTPELK